MAENKTQPTKVSVAKFIDGIDFAVLRNLAQEAWNEMNRKYPPT